MKVTAYARVTYQEQEEGGFPSLEEQERALRAFAERTGLTLDKIHTDHGLTPTQDTRAGLINILDDMDSDWEAVLIVSACRLRQLATTFSFDPVEELRGEGKRVLVANEDTAKQLAAVVAKLKAQRPQAPRKARGDTARHKREVAERLLAGREAGARAGKHQSGPAPYGYRRDYAKRGSDGVRLVPDPEESEVVQMIFREYLRLRSMKRLIKLLDDQGLRTRRGKRWSRAGVSWILKNDTYIGRVHFGDIRAKGQHDSIVAPITFNKVQQLIRVNNKRGKGEDDGPEFESAKPKAKSKVKAQSKGKSKAQPVAPAQVQPAAAQAPAARTAASAAPDQSGAAAAAGRPERSTPAAASAPAAAAAAANPTRLPGRDTRSRRLRRERVATAASA